MNSVSSRDEHGISTGRTERAWLPLLAFFLVLVALVILTVVPAVLLDRIARTNEEITETILPALGGLRDVAFAQERRVSSARSRFLTGDTAYDVRLEEARAAEESALRMIEDLTPTLTPASRDNLREIRRHIAIRDSLETELLRGGATLEEYGTALPQFDLIRDSLLMELDSLRQRILERTEARIVEAERWAAIQRYVSVVMGTVALAAAILVGWSARREHRLRRQIQLSLAKENQQRELAEARQRELERITESRVRLIRGVTHDVKNPLGAAKGYAELLEMGIKDPLTPGQRPLLEGIQRSVDRALAIITDLLDLARADGGGLTVEPVEVDLPDIVRETVEIQRSTAEATGHSLEFEARQTSNLVTDPDRVGQVLGNLLSNAIKYTPPPGRIRVECGVRDGTAILKPGPWATVEVSDSGPGIPVEQREAIFDEFTRLEEGSPHHGHGLGLAIGRRIARLLGGELTVEDSPLGGATFVLWLPLDGPYRAEPHEAPEEAAQPI